MSVSIRTLHLQRELEQQLAKVKLARADIERNFKRREAEMLRKLQDQFRRGRRELRSPRAGHHSEYQGTERTAEASGPGAAAGRSKSSGKAWKTCRRMSSPRLRRRLHKLPSQSSKKGARVILKGIRQPARVRRIISDDSYRSRRGLSEDAGLRDDVQEILREKDPPSSKLPKNVTFQQAGPKWDMSYQEINVIGKRAEEALEEVDRFLDQAALASVDRVRIVHGHGMGVLKKAVANLLAKSPHVEKFYQASPQEGGAGATIAELKTA